MATERIRPQPNVLFGLTHQMDGTPIMRVPRTVKVGIGRPAGPDIHVWIDAQGKWAVGVGDKVDGKRTERVTRFATKDEAKAFYKQERPKAPPLNYPIKLQYFTFTRSGADGTLEPDWDAIEKHGPLPTEIDIVFTDDTPLRAAYEWWSATGIQCRGDGVNAERLLALAATPEEKALAADAKDNGERFFPIIDGCYLRGCPYANETTDGRGKTVAPQCKPHGRLAFQLVNDIRLGGQAQFDTTSIRSVAQLHSSLHVVRTFTGAGDPERGFLRGIPLRLLLRPWKTNHAGQPGKAYAVSLEFRAESVQGLRRKLLEYAKEFGNQRQLAEAPKQLTAPEIEAPLPSNDEDEFEATTITAEFYPEAEEVPLDETPGEAVVEDDEAPAEPVASESETVAARTTAAATDLKQRLATSSRRAGRGGKAPVPEPFRAPEPEPSGTDDGGLF